MKKLFLLAVLTIANWAQAGVKELGNGGLVVVETASQKHYLYDFVESGIEAAARVDNSIPDELGLQELVQGTFPNDPEVGQDVKAKLNEIYRVVPELAVVFVEILNNYNWNVVNPKLVNVNDLGDTPLSKDNDFEIRQAAVRYDDNKTVYISRPIWNVLPQVHKAGLVMHEIAYAYFTRFASSQTSRDARALTSLVFNPNLDEKSMARVLSILSGASINRTWMTYAEYKYQRSPAYAQKCQANKQKANAWALKYIKTFSDISGKIKNAFDGFTAKNKNVCIGYMDRLKLETRVKLDTLDYQGSRYFIPTDDFRIVTEIVYTTMSYNVLEMDYECNSKNKSKTILNRSELTPLVKMQTEFPQATQEFAKMGDKCFVDDPLQEALAKINKLDLVNLGRAE